MSNGTPDGWKSFAARARDNISGPYDRVRCVVFRLEFEEIQASGSRGVIGAKRWCSS